LWFVEQCWQYLEEDRSTSISRATFCPRRYLNWEQSFSPFPWHSRKGTRKKSGKIMTF